MVRNRMVRDHFSRGYWPQDRSNLDTNPDEGRYSEMQDIRRPPMVGHPSPSILMPALKITKSIDQALREHCNIPAKFYFISTFSNDGKAACFTAPCLPPSVDVREFFDADKFQRCMERALSSNPRMYGSDI